MQTPSDTVKKTGKSRFLSLMPGWLFLFVLAHFGHHVMVALREPLMPFIRTEFSLDYTKAGFLLSAFTLTYGLSHLPVGWLSSFIDPRVLITIGVSGVAVFGLLFAFSQNYVMLVIFSAMMGIASGNYHPASAPMISASIEPERRGWAFGLHQIGGTGSHFLAPLIAVGLARVFSWRGAFIGLSIPTIVFGIYLYWALGKTGYKRTESREASHIEDKTTEPVSGLRLTAFLVLSVVGYALLHAVMSFISLFLVDQFKTTKEAAAATVAVVYSAGFWAAPIGGYLSDKLGRVPVVFVGSLLGGPIIYLLKLAPRGLGMYLTLIGIGAALYMRMPVTESYIMSHTSGKTRGTITGIYYFASRGGPSLFTPVLGSMIDHLGFSTSFTAVAGTMVAMTLICGVFLLGRRD